MDSVFHRGLGSMAGEKFPATCELCGAYLGQPFFSVRWITASIRVKIYRITEHNKLSLVDILLRQRVRTRLLHFSADSRFISAVRAFTATVDVFTYPVREDGQGSNIQSRPSVPRPDDVDRLHDAASGMCISEDGHYLLRPRRETTRWPCSGSIRRTAR